MIKHVLLLERGRSRFGCMMVLFGLCDVRHVPELKKNLISLYALHVNGFDYKTQDDCIRVNKGTLIVMKGKKNAENRYKLMRNTVVGEAAVAKSYQDSYYKEVQALPGFDQCL